MRQMIAAVVNEHRINPALHPVFSEELPRTNRIPGTPTRAQAQWGERVAPMIRVPDAALAAFIARTALHAVIHEAATSQPELLEHPLLVDELTRLLSVYLPGEWSPRRPGVGKRTNRAP